LPPRVLDNIGRVAVPFFNLNTRQDRMPLSMVLLDPNKTVDFCPSPPILIPVSLCTQKNNQPNHILLPKTLLKFERWSSDFARPKNYRKKKKFPSFLGSRPPSISRGGGGSTTAEVSPDQPPIRNKSGLLKADAKPTEPQPASNSSIKSKCRTFA